MENSINEELHNNDSDDPNGDGEGVWSPDIEQCFREALLLFPPCGRRKHILQEEGGGKMYGRNELIARHIMMRTGKSRTRKQVSSHIQVLARRKAKAEAGPSAISNNNNNNNNSSIDHQNSNNTSTSTSSLSLSQANNNGRSQQTLQQQTASLINNRTSNNDLQLEEIWLDRPIVTSKIRLVEFSAFIEYRNSSGSMQPQQISYGNTNYQQTSHDDHLNELSDSSYPQQTAYNPYLDCQQQQQQPLTSNHHLPAQFNQADPSFEGQKEQSIPQKSITKYQPQITSGFVKHSYIKIDYSKPELRQKSEQRSKQLESININLIQDKFPELNGSDGLYQRSGANCSDSFFLIKFWADLNNDYEFFIDDNQNSFFGFSSHFETIQPYQSITCSIKACSYGLQVVEKVEKIYGQFNPSNNRYSYNISRSPMCEFMIQFIKKLRQLPRASQMNSVLENFTVLQVITNELTSEILLCLAYVFEIASPQSIVGEQPGPNGLPPISPQYHVYKLTRD